MGLISFSKYQGTGNDFILIDDRESNFSFDTSIISKLCHRQYGIGADGLILLKISKHADFRMRIFNSNGKEAKMCGNGLRCLIGFLKELGIEKKVYRIETGNGLYLCESKGQDVAITFPALHRIQTGKVPNVLGDSVDFTLIDTGAIHFVSFVENINDPRFVEKARYLRSHSLFSQRKVNVNFAKLRNKSEIAIRTFEEGVEAETFSCGTGAAAVCFTAHHVYGIGGKVSACFLSQERLEFDLLIQNRILKVLKMKGPFIPVFKGTLEN